VIDEGAMTMQWHEARGFSALAARDDELEMDTELFDEQDDTLAVLAGLETTVEDVEPWQRLGDVLGRVTGEVDID
jgi:hypothetical protein